MTTTSAPTPFDIVRETERVQVDEKRALVAVTRELEREALADLPVAAAATLQDVRFLTPATRTVYGDLAARGTAVRLFARGLHAWLAPGVAGVALDEDDPLVDAWTVVLAGSRRPAVFAATDCGDDDVPDGDRLFRWALSRDPRVVQAVAALLGVGPSSSDGHAPRPRTSR